ncbi:MAG: tetratricopeptide repeat protein [Proteobacteria bacterium]|jgi:predicted negative regulator of RcsB-dependent stress response|nr:tetratricopeptide repeat protein [Pseudomonadota bacterium]
MPAYDHEEQDQLEELKAWWERWGAPITIAVVVAAIVIVGYQGWRWWDARHTLEASALYAAVDAASTAKDVAKAKDAVADLTDRYARTGYAARAELVYAKMLYDAGDHKAALTQLGWALDHASDDALKAIARYRIAQIHVDDAQYDAALAALDAAHPAAFDGMYADLRGDALAAAGRSADARKAYQTALAKLDAKSPYRNYVQLKLDSLPVSAQAAAQNAAIAQGAAAAAPAGAAPPAPASAAPAAPATSTAGKP